MTRKIVSLILALLMLVSVAVADDTASPAETPFVLYVSTEELEGDPAIVADQLTDEAIGALVEDAIAAGSLTEEEAADLAVTETGTVVCQGYAAYKETMTEDTVKNEEELNGAEYTAESKILAFVGVIESVDAENPENTVVNWYQLNSEFAGGKLVVEYTDEVLSQISDDGDAKENVFIVLSDAPVA